MNKNISDNSLVVRPHFINLVFQQLETFLLPDTIDWRCDTRGIRFSPEIICNEFYRKDLEMVRSQFMKDHAGRIDRHKIIALTQMIILNLQPITFRDSRKTVDDLFGLNVDFAFLFGLQFLVKWNEQYYPEQRFCEPINRFPTDIFLFRLNETKEGNDFWREHRKWFMARKQSNVFPLFLLWLTPIETITSTKTTKKTRIHECLAEVFAPG